MGIGDKLLDTTYQPQEITQTNRPNSPYFVSGIKCPVKFTDDIIEYAESKEYIGATLRPLQRRFLEELFNSKAEDGRAKYDQAVLCAGMRGGKSWLAAVIQTYMTQFMLQFDDPAVHFGLQPTRLTGQCIASSEVQAKETVYAHVESIVDTAPWWLKYINYLLDREENEGRHTLYQRLKFGIEFPEKRIATLSLHSNSSALAGKTSFCVVLDELSRFDVAEGAIHTKTQSRTANAVFSTVSRSVSNLTQVSKVVVISSPMFEDDYTMQLLCKAKDCWIGKQAPLIDTLRSKVANKVSNLYGMHATTFELNPRTDDNPSGFIEGVNFEAEKDGNPEEWRRDYLAIPPATINPFFEFSDKIDKILYKREPVVAFSDKLIEESAATDGGYVQRKYIGKTALPLVNNKINKHYICVDQGEKRDHFTLSMGHIEEVPVKVEISKDNFQETTKFKIVIDLITGWVPDRHNKITVSFSNVEEVIKILCNSFHVAKVGYDTWSSVESIQRLFSEGIYTEQIGANLEMYETLKQLIYQGQIELPTQYTEYELLVKELKQLTIIKSKKIDHLPNGSKDYADSVCRVAWFCYEDYIRETVHGKHIMPNRISLPTIRSVATAHELMQASERGGSAFGEIWGQAAPGTMSASGQGVFGETMIVKQNVLPNMRPGK